MLVAVGSSNPVKVAAAKAIIVRVWPQARIEATTVDSGVSSMPLSDDECIAGAQQRARLARETMDADLGIGLEGGVHLMTGILLLTGWVAVVDSGGRENIASAARMPLPPTISASVRSGKELGPLMDQLTVRVNTNQAEGAIGILTRGLMTRQRAFEAGIAYALAPWLSPEPYGYGDAP